jgi:hypothetical protein
VQGINDLVTPFFVVFLSEQIADRKWAGELLGERVRSANTVGSSDVAALPPASINAVEADSYWCVCTLLDAIQVCVCVTRVLLDTAACRTTTQ